MPKPTEPDKIPITSPAQLRLEFDSLHTALSLEETEHTWEKIDKAVKRFQAVVRGGAGKKELADDYVRGMRDKTLVNGLIRSLATERTRLSGSTLDLVGSSTRLGPQFAPLLPLYLPTLLRLLCRTNKLYINRSTTTIISIVKNTKLVDVLRFIVSEWHSESGKSATFREKAAEITAYILSSGPGGELQIEKDILDRRIEELEWIIKTAAVDKDVKVRAEAKKCWEVYRREWPERVANFTSPMTPTIRRYLNVNAAAPTASTTASSNASRAPAPVKKPRVPSALSSSVSHAPSTTAPAPVSTRPATALSRSAGPTSRPLHSATSHRPAPPSTTSSTEAQLRSTTSHPNGMGPPPSRPARAESTRSVSNPSTSRPASRNDDQRKELSSSTTSHPSTRAPSASSTAPVSTANSSSFRPTPAVRSGTSSAPPFKPAIRTATKSTTIAGAAVVEPRRARRIAQEPPPASAPPVSAPLPSSTSTSTLSRSTSSTTVRNQTLTSSTSSRPHPPIVPSTSAPFRPHKPTVSTLSSKSSTRTQPSISSRTGPISRPPLTASTAASAARAVEKPAASTSGTKSRREKERIEQDKEKTREWERKAAASEVAALEAAASKRKEQEAHEKEAEERKLREMAEKAKEVPLPVEEEEVESEGESEVEEEEEQVEEAFVVVESQESVAEEVGMESEYLIESQGVEVPVKLEEKEEDLQVGRESGVEEIAQIEVEKTQNGKIELSSEELENVGEVSPEAALGLQGERNEGPSEELGLDQKQAEDEPESPILEEIRLVGDLPPSPFLSEKHDTTPSSDSRSVESPSKQQEEEAGILSTTVSTTTPSEVHAAQASPSPLPDVSVALDTLATAIATDSNEACLLADTTLPRSPFLETAPSAQSFSASTPVSADSLDECFPTPVQQPIFAYLPPLSPEPCQTASIVLETPPRFDDPPAQLRLPGRPVVALTFPGRAPVSGQSARSIDPKAESPRQESAREEQTIESNENSEEDEEEEEESDTASPTRRPSNYHRRAVPPPTPLRSVPRQRQPVFLPEEASYTDNDTSFEEQEETDEESYQVPLNDAEYDDSDRGEVEVEVAGEQELYIEEKEEEDQSTPKAHTKFDSDVSSEVEAEKVDIVSEQAGRDEGVDEPEDEEESRFEIEQPELRFHDETESEPEVTMEDSTLSRESEDEEEEEQEERILEQQPTILKRSLRSRVVTVDLQSSSAKTPGRNRSREVLGEVQ